MVKKVIHPLSSISISHLCHKVEELCLDTALKIHDWSFDKMKIYSKDDKSPVSEADIFANEIITTSLKNMVKDFAVIGEEDCNQIQVSDLTERFWLVDPIDGTASFIKGAPTYTVNVALIENNLPILGVIVAPALNKMWSGYIDSDNNSTISYSQEFDYVNSKFISRHDKVSISVNKNHEYGIKALNSEFRKFSFEKLPFKENIFVKEVLGISSSLKFCYLAEGIGDCYISRGKTMEWDTAAGHAILKASGGSVRFFDDTKSDRHGLELSYGKESFQNLSFVAVGNTDILV